MTEDELNAIRKGERPPKGPLKEGDVEDYRTLKSDKHNVVDDGLTPDHIPSRAARVREYQNQLRAQGRKPKWTRAELDRMKEINQEAVTIGTKTKVHVEGSRTYGGKNKAAQVALDAMDLEAATRRDMEKMFEYLANRGELNPKIWASYVKVYQENDLARRVQIQAGSERHVHEVPEAGTGRHMTELSDLLPLRDHADRGVSEALGLFCATDDPEVADAAAAYVGLLPGEHEAKDAIVETGLDRGGLYTRAVTWSLRGATERASTAPSRRTLRIRKRSVPTTWPSRRRCSSRSVCSPSATASRALACSRRCCPELPTTWSMNSRPTTAASSTPTSCAGWRWYGRNARAPRCASWPRVCPRTIGSSWTCTSR